MGWYAQYFHVHPNLSVEVVLCFDNILVWSQGVFVSLCEDKSTFVIIRDYKKGVRFKVCYVGERVDLTLK